MLVRHLTFAVVVRFYLLKRVRFAPVGASSISVGIMALGVGEWDFFIDVVGH